jgi:carbonic anhydrase
MPERDILQAANELYADRFGKGDLPMPPGRRLAIVTCMDARLDPAKFLGLEEGDAHVIRNAGGLVTDDAIRSLIISHWLLGTQEVAVIAHTDCGMLTFSNDDLHARLREEAGSDASDIDFRPFLDLEASVRDSLNAIRESPHLPDSLERSGWVYDVRTGRLSEVAEVASPVS